MTDNDPVASFERRFRRSNAYEPLDDGRFDVTTTPFDASATVRAGDEAVSVEVIVEPPTLDAVVEGEDVADIVEEEWYRTFVRRLADAPNVTRTDGVSEPSADRVDDRVRVEVTFETLDPAAAVEDASALVGYVEGTWMEGVIPGYEYGEPAASLLSRASSGEHAETDGHRGGTPL